MIALLLIAAGLLAYANGANDNFKGVATLFGSGTSNYRRALNWATLTTTAGAICSIFIAEQLTRNFSGKGLVPDDIAGSQGFLCAVSLSAASSVL